MKNMYNKELFNKVVNFMGICECDPVTDEGIEEAQQLLGVRFPDDYISFIKEHGEGGIPGAYIFGIDGDYYTVVKYTKEFREKFKIPNEYVVVKQGKTRKQSWIICLDTSRMKDGSCPAVWFDRKTSEITEYAQSFSEVVDKEMMKLYLECVKPDEDKPRRMLPDGMGYKSVWMIIKGSDQKSIADKLLKEDAAASEYRAGLQEVNKGNDKAMVTADYEGKNYVVMPLTNEYFNQEWIETNCADFPECYAFLTERVSETHGFLKAVNGKIVRYYYIDEDDITDIGKPMVEEQMNEIDLPHNWEEYWKALDIRNKTILNEDVIMEIALEAGSVEEYPYEQVIVGSLK